MRSLTRAMPPKSTRNDFVPSFEAPRVRGHRDRQLPAALQDLKPRRGQTTTCKCPCSYRRFAQHRHRNTSPHIAAPEGSRDTWARHSAVGTLDRRCSTGDCCGKVDQFHNKCRRPCIGSFRSSRPSRFRQRSRQLLTAHNRRQIRTRCWNTESSTPTKRRPPQKPLRKRMVSFGHL
jgi:hypothetical protein